MKKEMASELNKKEKKYVEEKLQWVDAKPTVRLKKSQRTKPQPQHNRYSNALNHQINKQLKLSS